MADQNKAEADENKGGFGILELALLAGVGWFLYENFVAGSVAPVVSSSTATNLTNTQAIELSQIAIYEISSTDLQNLINVLQSQKNLDSSGIASPSALSYGYALVKGVALPSGVNNLGAMTPGEFANQVNAWVTLQEQSLQLANAGVSGLGHIGANKPYGKPNWSYLEVFNNVAR